MSHEIVVINHFKTETKTIFPQLIPLSSVNGSLNSHELFK